MNLSRAAGHALTAWILVGSLVQAQARPIAHDSATRTRGDELTVYLVTIGAGDEVFEKFGHTAIWVHDSIRNSDIAYNWGLFDFNDKDFIARLARGTMRYSMGAFEMHLMLQSYIAANRSAWAQELNLTPDQRLQVLRLAETNALPENRYYTYDYYRNNCSTLPRDLIDRVLSGGVRKTTDHRLTNATFRWHTLRLLGDGLLPFTGAQFALGHPADKPITEWQEMFLPLKLQEHIREVTVVGKSGGNEPLVLREVQIFAAKRPADRAAPPSYVMRFTFYGAALAAVLVVLLSLSLTGLKTTKVLLGIVATLWELFAGLAGTGLVLAWAVTDHYFMSRNENLLQFSPLMLALAVCFPLAFKIPRLQKPVINMAFAAAGLSLLGYLIQLLPGFRQPNGEIIGLALPVHLAMALVCWFLFSEKTKSARA